MSATSNGYPHQLGVQMREYVDKRLAAATEIQESIHVWLAEVLEQCKKSFARAEPELLPKTPSAKRSRRRLRAEELKDEEVELPPRKRPSLAKKGKPRKKGKDETESETEADDEDNVAPSPPRATRRTRAATRSTATTKSTRTTRTRKKPNSDENKKRKSPVFSIKMDNLKKSEEKTLETLKPATPLSSDDLRNKLKKKSSVPSLTGTPPLSPKTPRTLLAGTKPPTCSGSPRPAVGFLSVKERASQYEQKVLSSGGNTPTPKGPRINGISRVGSNGSSAVKTPASGRTLTPVTPSTVTHKSSQKISLSSHHTSSSSAKRIIVKKNSVAPQPSTPVSRMKSRSSATGNRASRRLSLKRTASTNRRSSIVRHSRQTQAQQETLVPDDKPTASERSSWVSVNSEGNSNYNNSHPEGDTQEKRADVQKSRGKLTLKKTKVLRPKATRSAAKQEKTDEREISVNSSSEAHESIEVNDARNSKENRRGTVTVQKATSANTHMQFIDGIDQGELAEGICQTETLEKGDRGETDTDIAMKSDGDRSTEREEDCMEQVEVNDKVRDENSSGKSSSDDDNDKSDTMENCVQTRMSDSSNRASRKSDTKKSSRTSRSSGQRHTPKLSRSSSEQGKTASTEVEGSEDISEPAENLRPKRTTRAAQSKASVSSSTSKDMKSGGLRQSSRLKSRSSQTSRSGSVADVPEGTEEMAEEEQDNVFAAPKAPGPRPPRASRSQRKRVMSESDEATETETKRPCVDEQKSEGEGTSSEVESAKEEIESGDDRTASDSDADVVDRSPSPKCPANKVVRPHPASFLNALNKDKNKLFNLNTAGMKSFLRSSPAKRPLTLKEQEMLRRKELEEKQRKENERMEKRKQQLQAQAEAKKRQREEHWRKVQNMRLQKQKREQEEKDRLLEKMEHKNRIPEQVMEVKRKEKQEKKQIRQQKHTEAEERRLQDEAERLRKLKEKEEEDRQHAELLQRKREYEEQERAKRLAEEKQRQEEHQREMERKRKEEEMRQLVIQQEQERQKLKQQAERERELRLKAERMEKERQEQELKGQKDLKEELMKLRELEKQRKMAEKLRQEEMRQMEGRYKQLMTQQNNMLKVMSSSNPLAEKTALNSTVTLEKSPQSYQITPLKKFTKKQSEESYDITGLDSDASTDEEDAPKRKIPRWAQGSDLKIALVNQYYHKSTDWKPLFGIITLPDLNQIFVKKKPRFNKRTSSAIWDSPLLKAGHSKDMIGQLF